MTSPPFWTTNLSAAVTLEGESEIESSAVDPASLPDTVIWFAETVPALLTYIAELFVKTTPSPISRLPAAPVAATAPPCSTVTVELPISPSSSGVPARLSVLPVPVTSIDAPPNPTPRNTGWVDAFHVDAP